MLSQTITRKFSKYINQDKTAKSIRQKFLDYFINDQNHNFVRSSPVVPFCDPSVAFVNAGMNQFKGILMGRQEPQHKKVVNSQKCVRVGGKHNDINVVGSDGYHHTFFEMLGNWSFGDYFKKEACLLSWKLLTDIYKIPSNRLYVTYFQGDDKLGLKADLETKEIWKSLGIPDDRILPFTTKDNFWEMALTGPCGPCTEIHIDHLGTTNRSTFINKGLHDLTELWNIVFIQYNRKPDGSIELLPQHHVDTGMGFERLTAVLQGKISNYDTDNFTYLLKAIQKNCSDIPEYKGRFGELDWDSLDRSYRILADHARMITVCLADGLIPEQNQKLRRILRKSFHLSETVFKKDKGLIKELSNYVIENLGPIYSEMEYNVKQIHQIIDFEEDVYKSLRQTSINDWNNIIKQEPKLINLDIIESPGLISAYNELKKSNIKIINGQLGYKLCDSFGLDEETLIKLSEILNIKFNQEDLRNELNLIKLKSKEHYFLSNSIIYEKLLKLNLTKTETNKKYDYNKSNNNKYKFNDLKIQLLKIIKEFDLVPEIGPDIYCSLLLDKTNLYTESGGQLSDRGQIRFGKNLFEITETVNCDGYILHKGFLKAPKTFKLKSGQCGLLSIDQDYRLNNMKNHTAIHLLNAIIKDLKGATCQKSSKVTGNYLNLDLGIFGEKLTIDEIDLIETKIHQLIDKSLNVKINEIDSQTFLSLNNVTLIPGEIYPETGIRLVEIKSDDGFVSREPCCGTHVFNTKDIEDFSIINLKSMGRSTVSICAVTGERAKLAKKNAMSTLDSIQNFEKTVNDNIDKPEILNMAIAALKHKLNYNIDDPSILPITVKQKCLTMLTNISKHIKDIAKGNLKEFIEIEMQNAIESNISITKNKQKYIVHYLRSSMVMESVPLQKATRLCPDIPVLVISYSDNIVKARCCVPKNLRNKNFSAEKWLKGTVASTFKSQAAPPKGQDGTLVCNMKAKKVNVEDWDPLLNESLAAAKEYINQNL